MSTLSPKSSAVLAGILLTILILLVLILDMDVVIIRLFGVVQPNEANFIGRSFYWVFVLVMAQYAIKIEMQPLLIWEERKYRLSMYFSSILVLTAVIMVSLAIGNLIISKLTGKWESSEVLKGMADVFRSNKALLVYTALTAGVTEELIFRGYLQPRLEMLLNNPLLAILLSSLIFGLAHYRYGTIQNVLDPFIIGLVLGTYYWKYRNIKVTILFHFLWDLAGLFLLIRRH